MLRHVFGEGGAENTKQCFLIALRTYEMTTKTFILCIVRQ